MKKLIAPRDPEEIQSEYPLGGLVAGWWFRVAEASSGHYVAEGVDAYGRAVTSSGDCPERTLADCVEFATRVVQDQPA